MAALLILSANNDTVFALGFAVLQSVQAQELNGGQIRIFLQFNGPVSAVPETSNATTNYVLRIPDAAAAATVPGIVPVNGGLVQGITISQTGTSLSVSVLFTQAVKALLSMPRRGLVQIFVPSNTAVAQHATQNVPSASDTSQQSLVVRIRYADVSEIASVLSGSEVAPSSFQPSANSLNSGTGISEGGSLTPGLLPNTAGQGLQGVSGQLQQSQSTPQQSPGSASAGERISETIAVDRRLNALILTGTGQQIAQAKALIAQLDVPVPSIMLDTRVLELTESGSKSIGLDWGQIAGGPITHIYNNAFSLQNQLPTYSGVALQTNIFLLINNGKARLLGSPRILTQSGVPASILTGDSLPIRTTTPIGVGGVGAVTTQVQYINVGVNLQILPRVTGDGQVQADIFAEVSSLTGFTSAGDPQISSRQAQTRVDLSEGETLLIGGLLQQRDIRNVQKIPILGDIPILGELFRLSTETREDTNLVITITPHIVPGRQH